MDPKDFDWVLLGYPDDEGINNNGGRIGSALGPEGFRKVFYKMTPHLQRHQDMIKDLGDWTGTGKLENRHIKLRAELLKLHAQEKKIISIGGGHDYGFPDGAALCEYFINKGERPFIINFDAHLDVRPLEDKINSGTPFYRLLEEFGPKIDFVEFGIQPHCNAKAHLEWAQSKGAVIYHRDEIRAKGFHKLMDNLTHQFEDRPTFVSVDIDAFSSADAPGCSQSWPTGLSANEFIQNISLLRRRLNIRHFGVYELSPPLDKDLVTQRLAAQIIFELMTWEEVSDE
ncbi:MAG: formimidoylglutamase [Bdellovibrionota bacterium]